MKKVHSVSDARDSSLSADLPLSPAGSGSEDPPAMSAVVSAGSLLRQARETAGLHIAALAVSLKVPVKKLEALEADRYDLLPDAVFVRALASSVCRTLKVDTALVLEKLPRTSGPKLAYQNMGINTPFRAPGVGPNPSIWTQVSRPAVLAGFGLLLAALVLVSLPSVKSTVDSIKSDAETRAVTMKPLMSAAPGAAADAMSAGASAPHSSDSRLSLASANVDASASGSPVGPALPSSMPASASLQGVVLPTSPASAVVQVASTGVVVFSAKSPSWVEVTDSKGIVVLRRTLGAGEVAGASGALPLTAVVGRADVTQVQIRGKAFDLVAVAKDNVARFEVK